MTKPVEIRRGRRSEAELEPNASNAHSESGENVGVKYDREKYLDLPIRATHGVFSSRMRVGLLIRGSS